MEDETKPLIGRKDYSIKPIGQPVPVLNKPVPSIPPQRPTTPLLNPKLDEYLKRPKDPNFKDRPILGPAQPVRPFQPPPPTSSRKPGIPIQKPGEEYKPISPIKPLPIKPQPVRPEITKQPNPNDVAITEDGVKYSLVKDWTPLAENSKQVFGIKNQLQQYQDIYAKDPTSPIAQKLNEIFNFGVSNFSVGPDGLVTVTPKGGGVGQPLDYQQGYFDRASAILKKQVPVKPITPQPIRPTPFPRPTKPQPRKPIRRSPRLKKAINKVR